MENEISKYIQIGNSIGRSQAYGAVAYKCAVEQATYLKRIKETEGYKALGLDFDQFCEQEVGLSRRRVNTIIQSLNELGETYFRFKEIVTISPETYRHIAPKVQDDRIEIAGEMVPIVPENAGRIRDAVNRLRAELRKANEDVDLLTSPEIASLQMRLDAWLEDLRRLVPRYVANREDAALRGMVEYTIVCMQQLAGVLGE